jgi:hypothetical protein
MQRQLRDMTIYNVFFALLMGIGTTQLPYTNAERGFTMVLPAGFLGEGEDPLNTRAIACFVEPSGTEQRTWTRLCVERRGGSLPVRARQMTFAWKGHDLRGASFNSQWAGEDVAVFATLVPLRKEPVWLVAMAPLANRARAEAALVATLVTLQGESAAVSRAERAGSRFGMVVSIAFAIGAGMWIMQRRQQQRR